MSGTERGRRRSKREPRPICPWVREGILALGDEARREGNTSTPCTNRVSGGGGREFCYLGPKDGYAAGLTAHS
jgi:hypothetical protein